MDFEPKDLQDEFGGEAAEEAEHFPVPVADLAPRSLYALLNVSPASSKAEINKAYKSLAPVLHPDKHPSHLQEAASARFQQIQRAHEVLTDDRLRSLYDAGGEEMLASGLQVGPKLKTTQEVCSINLVIGLQ